MGYHIKMPELAETGRQLVRQTEEWTKQLQAVRACVQDFIQDPGCSGRAAVSMKAYMKEVHLTLLDWMLTNIASYRSSLVLYINGYREIEADQNAEVSQDVLEEELEFLTQGKAAYEQTAEELGQVYRELRRYMDIGADICDELPDQFDSAVRYVEKVRCDVGEYEEQHSHDLESFHEMNGYIKSMMERHIGGDVRGITSYQAGSLSRQPEYESASAVYSGSRAYVEDAVERVKSGLFNLNSCAKGREEKASAAGVPVGGVVAAKGVALGGKAEKGAGLNAGIFRHMDELRGQAGGKGKIGNVATVSSAIGKNILEQLVNKVTITDNVSSTYEEITFNKDLYDNNKFYKKTADYISQISEIDESWDEVLVKFHDVYLENEERYKVLSNSCGIPPELIAAIHYRENTVDYMSGSFNVYLHNGDELGKESTKAPYPNLYNEGEFDAAAIDAMTGDYFKGRAQQLCLTSESKDLTSMVTFSVLYNGWQNGGLSNYAYSGTDIYTKGKYSEDYQYDSESVDQNCGTYLLLKELLE